MNFGSDQRVREAFRATLQGDRSSASVLGTQEIDAADVLEVTDLANAIARAEEVIRARSSRVLTSGPDSSAQHEPRGEDIFDKLVAGHKPAKAPEEAEATATDDASGPAVHAPYRPTPLPPRMSPMPLPPGIQRPATLLRAPEPLLTPIPTIPPPSSTPASPPVPPAAPVPLDALATQPLPAMAVPPAARTAPILVLDEDAFYHPAGRIRTLADATLDGYRAEPTLMMRLRQRRHALKWVVAGVVATLALFAIFAVAVGIGRSATEGTAAESAPTEKPAVTITAATTRPAEIAEKADKVPTTEPKPATASPDVPVFDVNSLENAPPSKQAKPRH